MFIKSAIEWKLEISAIQLHEDDREDDASQRVEDALRLRGLVLPESLRWELPGDVAQEPETSTADGGGDGLGDSCSGVDSVVPHTVRPFDPEYVPY